MTVSTALNKIVYSGNGATTVFPFTFPGVAPSDIQVFFTDINGNVSLISPVNYTLILNPATGTNPTGAGGSVTYNPLGVPIPLGTFLTIYRNLPFVQTTSLANQGTLYQPVEEAALDYQMMATQQVIEVQDRALVVAVSDPIPNALPAAAARANLFLAFDGSGNPIASQPSGSNTPVSSVMIPVVTAASLPAARTALGLGTIATESIGLGLEDNGSGAVQTFFGVVADSISQSVISSFHQKVRAATGALTYTLPLSSTLFNGFGFWVDALTASVIFAPNAADAFVGMSTGASFVMPPGSRIFLVTDAAGKWYPHFNTFYGNTAPLNLQINATVGSSALTIALKDAAGNDPSPASPVVLGFPGPTGVIVQRALTAPLSITVPSGATLGLANNQANRIWIAWFDNAGTPILGVYNSLASPGVGSGNILAWDESVQISGTAISAAADNAQTWYTASGVTTKSFRIIGFIESTQATAGTWTASPSKIQLFGPGIKRPGDIVRTYASPGSGSVSVSLQNAADLVRFTATGDVVSINTNENFSWNRGATPLQTHAVGGGAVSGVFSASGTFYDFPGTISATSYSITCSPTAITEGFCTAEEIFV